MTQAFRPARTRTIASAILCVCGLVGITESFATVPTVTTPVGQRAIQRSNKAALQGDGQLAAESLAGVPRSHFAGTDLKYRRCMLRRFGAQAVAPAWRDAGDPFVSDVLNLYQKYWWHALMSPPDRDRRTGQLQSELSLLLGEPTTIENWGVLDSRVAAELQKRGYHSQLGVTPPLRELMIWRKQESSLHEVELPTGSYPVRVEVLNDFVTRGWSGYARCDRSSNAGWATQDRVYAVGPAFANRLDNDVFRASLLGHETQHFADLAQFPELAPWELEYRAKLAELWLAKGSLAKLLGKFHRDQGDDQQVPHLFANKRLMHALHAQLSEQGVTTKPDLRDVSPHVLRAAARELLIQDTRAREGAASVAGSTP